MPHFCDTEKWKQQLFHLDISSVFWYVHSMWKDILLIISQCLFFPIVSVRGFQSLFCEKQLKRMNLSLGKNPPNNLTLRKIRKLYFSKNNKNKTSFKCISGTCFSANTNIIPVFSFSVQVIFQSQILFSIPKFDVTVWALYKRRIDEPRHMGTNIFIL